MNTLTTETRREKIKEMLQKTDHPVTASSLAEHFSVSRQIIVGDIALLRASGLQILATPRGYLMDSPSVQEDKNRGMIACRHTPEQLRDALYTIVHLHRIRYRDAESFTRIKEALREKHILID